MQQKIEAQWTTIGFNQVFDQYIQTGVSYVEAYLKAEEDHVKLFGHIRFKSYESFRGCRHNLIFKKK